MSIATDSPDTAYRAVHYQASANFTSILQFLNASILVSTYQAGKVLCLGTHQGELKLSFLNFDRAMGLAVSPSRIAVGTRRQVHFLHASPEIAPRIEPSGNHDGCWAMRTNFYPGNVHGHDLAFSVDGLWIAKRSSPVSAHSKTDTTLSRSARSKPCLVKGRRH